MPKQVRLRRGTSTQHSTFTGAEGEVTFDTTKKCLIVHDGVTPGGIPLHELLRLNAGASTTQEIKSKVYVSGGDEDSYGLRVDWDVTAYRLVASEHCTARFFVAHHENLSWAGTVNLNFRLAGRHIVTLGGNTSFTASGWGFGYKVEVIIYGDPSSSHTLAWPAGWRWIGGAAPASLAAGKAGILALTCHGMSDSNVFAQWNVEA